MHLTFISVIVLLALPLLAFAISCNLLCYHYRLYWGLFLLFLFSTVLVWVLSCLSCVQLFANPWTAVCQALLTVGFPRQEYWSGFLFPSAGDLSNSRTEPTSAVSPVMAGRFFTIWATEKAHLLCCCCCCGYLGHEDLFCIAFLCIVATS